MIRLWQRFIDAQGTDPDDIRRQRLLNIILAGLFAITALVLLLSLVTALAENALAEARSVLITGVVGLAGFIGIYLVGRYASGRLSRLLFLIFLILLLLVSDTPDELTNGRSTIYWVMPIMMASVLFRPRASFIVTACLIVLHFTIEALFNLEVQNYFPPAIYMVIALIAWLSAHSLEKALKDLRQINQELDQRVIARTQDLDQALQREAAESSRLQAVLNSIAESVLVFDLQGALTLANQAFSRLNGSPVASLLGQDLRSLLGSSLPVPQKETALAISTNQAAPGAAQLEWGKQIFDFSLSPVTLSSGQVIGQVAVLHDVTYEVEISRMKTRFVSMVSHELRNPLNAILGLGEILLENVYGPLNTRQQVAIRHIMTSAQQLSQLVKDLLDLARIEAGALAVQQVSFDPQTLLNRLVEAYDPLAQQKELRLLPILDPRLPAQLVGDPQWLYQAVANLVGNAIKFTEAGRVSIWFNYASPETWEAIVSDTGPGIAPEAQAHIFEPFWQVDSASGRKKGGVGLGLSIVLHLVERMGGQIHLESQPGAGSSFTLVFPLHTPPVPDAS